MFTLPNDPRMCTSQNVLYYVFMYVVKSCEKETCRSIKFGVRYDYNNEIESEGKHEKYGQGKSLLWRK